ncbi:STN domain-containing protein, partial [Mariniphaga sediminis]|uniref:STN domain-containing protein n=1 Tax=Mariniphaga sediminis TaxID=1628158 RepID=UPI003564E6E6
MARLTAFLILVGMVQVFASESYSQETKLTLRFTNIELEKVLGAIEDKSEFFFLYNKDLIDVEQKVNVNLENKKITEILDVLLEGKNIRYFLFDRQIVLSNQQGETGVSGHGSLVQQQRTVSGKVTDSGGQPLPGVTVVVKGTTQGTVTGADGEYTITNIPENATLVLSFVGMKTQEVAVGTQTNIDIKMEEETIGLDEVVAVGYGT